MKSAPLHSWRLSPKNAIALQRRLRDRIMDCPLRPWPEFVAGADISYAKEKNDLIAAVVVLRLSDLETVAQSWVARRATYPYVPGLLTFREAPAVLAAFKRLRQRWDVAIFDGQGRAHPRGMGLAAHIGLWLDAPTVGCAKSRLVGEAAEPGPAPGDHAPLTLDGRVIGAVLRTRRNVKPLFVSAGHKSNLADSIRLVMACCSGYRVTEPIRRAHALVTRLRSQTVGIRRKEAQEAQANCRLPNADCRISNSQFLISRHQSAIGNGQSEISRLSCASSRLRHGRNG